MNFVIIIIVLLFAESNIAQHGVKIMPTCIMSDPLTNETLINLIKQKLGHLGCNPPRNRTCQDLHLCYPSSPSGHYQILLDNGSSIQVYCDMEGTNCGGNGGWLRVANFNVTQTSSVCPQGLVKQNHSGVIVCSRPSVGCTSVVFSTFPLRYSTVCGRLRGYQLGPQDAFFSYINNTKETIDDVYFDGATITYGRNPRKHIWTYANGGISTRTLNFDCPCNAGSDQQAPPFVGEDYYCESASSSLVEKGIFIENDVLWDGLQCNGAESLCCNHSNMPWFIKQLNETINEDIELRLCSDISPSDEGSPLDIIEIYVR